MSETFTEIMERETETLKGLETFEVKTLLWLHNLRQREERDYGQKKDQTSKTSAFY